MAKLFYAELQTANYDFRCIVESEQQAHDRLSAAWNTHRRRTGATLTWRELRDSMNITEIEIGKVFGYH